jgi:2-keto-4-pentenoate hydratase/2-oxohepta-3-ene-1,7-dioic acid hydratase in catechol pathway
MNTRSLAAGLAAAAHLAAAPPARATKLVTYEKGGERRAGVVVAGHVADLARLDVAPPLGPLPSDLLELLQRGDESLAAVARAARDLGARLARPEERQRLRAAGLVLPLEEVRLRAPLARPHRILAIGLNYRGHAAEMNLTFGATPEVFAKECLPIGPGEPIVIPPGVQQPDYEGELAFVIGRRASRVAKADALEHVAGYMAFNDVSARDVQRRGTQWVLGKSVDTFAVEGPYLVLRDEIPDPQRLRVRTSIGEEVLQDSTTADMHFGVADIIAEVTRYLTLEPGTIVITGSPAGVGAARKPPRWLRPGETIRVEVEGLGVLESPVEAGR